jgi:hypothetical protein
MTTKEAKSVGNSNSNGPKSFAASKASEINMGRTAKSGSSSVVGPNIVIDIESENLTYNQARSIRLQLQRDVE